MTTPATTFAVTGASGHVGGAVARALLAEDRRVRVLTRDPDRLDGLEGAEVVRGGFADADAVGALVTGADGLFVVSLPGGEERLALHEAVLRAAAAADVAHVVVLSFLRPSPDAAFPQGRWHAVTEGDLRRLLPGRGTAVRPSLYTQALVGSAGVVRDGRLLAPAGTGRLAPVDRDDVAPVVARVLLDATHRGEALDVTGPEAVGWAEVAAALPGAPAYEDVAPAAFAALLREQGLPEPLVEGVLGVFADVRAGRFDAVSDAVRAVGRVQPRTLRDTFAAAAA